MKTDVRSHSGRSCTVCEKNAVFLIYFHRVMCLMQQRPALQGLLSKATQPCAELFLPCNSAGLCWPIMDMQATILSGLFCKLLLYFCCLTWDCHDHKWNSSYQDNFILITLAIKPGYYKPLYCVVTTNKLYKCTLHPFNWTYLIISHCVNQYMKQHTSTNHCSPAICVTLMQGSALKRSLFDQILNWGPNKKKKSTICLLYTFHKRLNASFDDYYGLPIKGAIGVFFI